MHLVMIFTKKICFWIRLEMGWYWLSKQICCGFNPGSTLFSKHKGQLLLVVIKFLLPPRQNASGNAFQWMFSFKTKNFRIIYCVSGYGAWSNFQISVILLTHLIDGLKLSRPQSPQLKCGIASSTPLVSYCTP